jgi:hypothetical protein
MHQVYIYAKTGNKKKVPQIRTVYKKWKIKYTLMQMQVSKGRWSRVLLVGMPQISGRIIRPFFISGTVSGGIRYWFWIAGYPTG